MAKGALGTVAGVLGWSQGAYIGCIDANFGEITHWTEWIDVEYLWGSCINEFLSGTYLMLNRTKDSIGELGLYCMVLLWFVIQN